MDGNCISCKHWSDHSIEGYGSTYKVCSILKINRLFEIHNTTQINIIDMVCIGPKAELITRNDFGCILYSPI